MSGRPEAAAMTPARGETTGEPRRKRAPVRFRATALGTDYGPRGRRGSSAS